jgi:lipoyl(octanoyl) transferase
VLAAGDIPVVQTDRGGQVTYHGPGQLVAYPLLDLRRLGLSVHGLVEMLEQTVVDLAAAHGVTAVARRDARGVYVDGRKLASIGLRVRRGASYHGLALNVDMDLAPFGRINPCGMAGLEVTSLSALGIAGDVESTGSEFARLFAGRLAALEHEQHARQRLQVGVQG